VRYSLRLSGFLESLVHLDIVSSQVAAVVAAVVAAAAATVAAVVATCVNGERRNET